MMNRIPSPAGHLRCVASVALLAVVASLGAYAQQEPAVPNAPVPAYVLTAQSQTPPPLPGTTQAPPASGSVITFEQALDLAKRNNPTLQANQTLILQNKAQEITANLRPNPVLSWDTQYLPFFEPSLFTESNYWETQAQYDIGIGYLFERGKKRQHRLDAAKTATAVTEAQVADAQRTVLSNAAQLYVSVLLAKANLELAENLLESYKRTVKISQDRFDAGALSKNDLLKIQLQTLQFETDVHTDRLARAQALASLRQFLGFDSIPADYDVAGSLVYESVSLRLEDVQARALANRPDLQAAQRSVIASESQVGLAKANGKVDLDVTFNYTRLNQSNLGAFYFNLPLPVFNRNQGEIARTQYVVNQSQFQQKAAEQQVFTDVKNAYENLHTSEQIVQLYAKGYLQQASQSLDITRFSYEHGAASLLDFLDAERSYRSTELGYRQALAAYMTALEQLRQAVGSRDLK
jgi:cobalt-zinc-cadmium efflux system outer membrane protein